MLSRLQRNSAYLNLNRLLFVPIEIHQYRNIKSARHGFLRGNVFMRDYYLKKLEFRKELEYS